MKKKKEREKLVISLLFLNMCMDIPGDTSDTNLPANAGDVRDASSIPGSGRSPREGNSNPLQYSYLENPMDKGAWGATVQSIGPQRVGHD